MRTVVIFGVLLCASLAGMLWSRSRPQQQQQQQQQ
jgi:hypothetical protein